MSVLLDSLRRHRGRRHAVRHPDRATRADAVLATLRAPKRRARGLARPFALVGTGVGFALLAAWWLWT